MADQSNKAAAQAQSAKNAAKAQRTEDGKQAMLDYESEMAATRAKTERLRALRLAREATTPPPPPSASAQKGGSQNREEIGRDAVPVARPAGKERAQELTEPPQTNLAGQLAGACAGIGTSCTFMASATEV